MTDIGPGFHVDLDMLQAAIDEMKEAVDMLEGEKRNWTPGVIERRIGQVGTDPVSMQLRKNMVIMAERQGNWLNEYTAQVRLAYEALKAQKKAYEDNEQRLVEMMRSM